MNPYEELGLDKAATDGEIRAAHRAAVKRHHPDRGGDGEKFDRVQRAFAILRDPLKRRTFDETGVCSEEPASSLEQRSVTAARAAIMAVVLGPGDLIHIDVVTSALSHVAAQIEGLQGQRRTLDHNLSRITQARARIKNISDHPDVVASMFDWQEAELRAAMPKIDESIEVQKAARDILKRYSYTFEMAGRSVSVSHGASSMDMLIE